MASVPVLNDEQVVYLRSLRAVKRVSCNRIRYTEEFKGHCMERYFNGDSPAVIFREAGLDSAIIGYKRIERCIARWRKEGYGIAGKGGTMTDGEADDGIYKSESARKTTSGGDLRDTLIAQQVHRIDELERELKRMRKRCHLLEVRLEEERHVTVGRDSVETRRA
ncbi:transposase [Bifidobacterium catulorum]|uniref:transposase n=1 Tax=Bifidobacterium catulorum TaxID=1630173 RepID=UPI0011B1FC9C|nr:transposase [Bifidobacterium catulorum]